MNQPESDQQEQQPPVLRITPNTTAEEVAAIVAVLAVSGSPESPARRAPEWSARHRTLRRPHHAGPGAWRSSGLPR